MYYLAFPTAVWRLLSIPRVWWVSVLGLAILIAVHFVVAIYNGILRAFPCSVISAYPLVSCLLRSFAVFL